MDNVCYIPPPHLCRRYQPNASRREARNKAKAWHSPSQTEGNEECSDQTRSNERMRGQLQQQSNKPKFSRWCANMRRVCIHSLLLHFFLLFLRQTRSEPSSDRKKRRSSGLPLAPVNEDERHWRQRQRQRQRNIPSVIFREPGSGLKLL